MIPPVYTDVDGHLVYCPSCFPMLDCSSSYPIHDAHHKRGYRNTKGVRVFEDDVELDNVEEYIGLVGRTGAVLREFVEDLSSDFDRNGRRKLLVCRRNGHLEFLRRLRFAPHARIVRTGADLVEAGTVGRSADDLGTPADQVRAAES